MMQNLLRAELLRMLSSRVLLAVAVIGLAIGCWAGAGMAENTKPYTALDWDEARRQSNDAQINLDVACGSGVPTAGCSSLPVNITVEGFLRPQLNIEELAIATLRSTSLVGLFAVVVLITVMVGSEFTTGSIGTQLTFTPRRLPLLWAKGITAAIGGAGLMACWSGAAILMNVFAFLLLHDAGELVAGPQLAAQLGRCLLAGLVLAAMAAMVTMALASTVKTWVLISAGLVASQLLGTSRPLGQVASFLPTTNLSSLINGEWSQGIYGADLTLHAQSSTLSYGYSLGYALFWLAVFGIWAAVSFSRRDILT